MTSHDVRELGADLGSGWKRPFGISPRSASRPDWPGKPIDVQPQLTGARGSRGLELDMHVHKVDVGHHIVDPSLVLTETACAAIRDEAVGQAGIELATPRSFPSLG